MDSLTLTEFRGLLSDPDGLGRAAYLELVEDRELRSMNVRVFLMAFFIHRFPAQVGGTDEGRRMQEAAREVVGAFHSGEGFQEAMRAYYAMHRQWIELVVKVCEERLRGLYAIKGSLSAHMIPRYNEMVGMMRANIVLLAGSDRLGALEQSV